MKKRIYGPVPSRRLGYSLGVDCVPFKTCSYNCIYCQLGKSADTTVARKPYIAVDSILRQLSEKLKQNIRADHITLGGSGEPTLHSKIGPLIRGVKKLTSIPVAVLTNGSLLGDPGVQQALMDADVILPSLDAHEKKGFERINRPHPSIRFEEMVAGLSAFRKVFPGQIWLEIFILEGINDTDNDARQFKALTDTMAPNKVHLNTAVRPATESQVKEVSRDRMETFCALLGEKAEVAFNLRALHEKAHTNDMGAELLNLLARRPCTLDDLAAGLQVSKLSIGKGIQRLSDERKIQITQKGERAYYQLAREEDP